MALLGTPSVGLEAITSKGEVSRELRTASRWSKTIRWLVQLVMAGLSFRAFRGLDTSRRHPGRRRRPPAA